MSASDFRFVGRNRRVREDRRFVVGKGRFAADVKADDVLHVALAPSMHAAARIVRIDAGAALASAGVRLVIDGADLAAGTEPLMNGLETPHVKRYPLAVGRTRYSGEWTAAVVADSRALAEDAAERIVVDYEPLPFVLDAEEAYAPTSPPVHPEHGSNVLLDKTFVWGDVEQDFADAPRTLSFRVKWGRSSTVPIETFGVLAAWDPWRETLDVWASIQMPKFVDQLARSLRMPANAIRLHHDVDVGGSYGSKRGLKHAVLAAYASRRLGRPVRLIEDRLENMRAGDAHGPERLFDVSVAFDERGVIRSMKMRALDNVGAYAGRSPYQLGKPIGAIVGPYKIGSVRYQAIAVTTNKAVQEAVRGFGQSPTNYAIETAVDRVARDLGLDRLEVRRRNLIGADEFPYVIPSGSAYDSGDYQAVIDKTLAHADYSLLLSERDALREQGWLAGLGIAACLEPSGGNSAFEPLLNPKNATTTWMESCRINVDATGQITAAIHTNSSGQGHETLAAAVIGEALEIDPDLIRVVRPDSLASLPGNSPVGSRMAIMLGGAAFRAAQKIRRKLVEIAAHQFGEAADDLIYSNGDVRNAEGSKSLTWLQLVNIAHRNYHLMPAGMPPGLESSEIMQVPSGGALPGPDGRVQMYPCYSFEFHLILVAIDRIIGKPEIRRYVIGHDCGTIINPHIVKGMTLGGIAHGLGAALMEEFVYDEQGQMIAQSFMDYLLPSAHEMPQVEIVHHSTPSPLTVLGQKGAGESGYLGAPAAIASAINDAVQPLGISFSKLPIRMSAISDAVAAASDT
ncbi:MAG TPA: xanthine dehydrogenase family protein molybdopterin-binding subunit [Beijerinckiaceae bacterium]|nr:xanthine dehydrogenase family protein molybdopterin-binding subunit [Beijerinckiaceae bacterium]